MVLRPGFPVPPVQEPRRPLVQTFTGWLIVRLVPDMAWDLVNLFPDRSEFTLEEVAREFASRIPQNEELLELLADLGNPRTARLIHRWTVEQTDTIESGVGLRSLRSARTLNSYFSVDLHDRNLAQLARAAARFRAIVDVIDTAFVEPTVVPAAAVTPDRHTYDVGLHSGQGYVFGKHHKDSEKSGVNAIGVWDKYDGAGVKLVIVEEGWKLDHPDLPQPGGAKLPLLDPYMVNGELWRDHGTSTLGVIAALDHSGEGLGIVGIAPSVTIPGLASTRYSTSTKWEVPDAIAAAIEVLGPGDVLLLEIQTLSTEVVNGVALPSGYPIEVVDPWLDVIRLAHLRGITVVEPAGNPSGSRPSYDLSKAAWTPIGADPRSLDPADTATFIDSGAILVGACESVPVADDLHDRLEYAWWGKRIDCYAWGQKVLTTTCYGLDFGTNTIHDTCPDGAAPLPTYGNFNGTSAAAAVIAGVVALIQQMHVAALAVAASPTKVRQIVRDPTLGTPIGDIGGTVAAMPDLVKVAASMNALPEVYVRDSTQDIGAVPSPVVSMSPDVFVLKAALDLQNLGPPYDDWAQFVPNDLVVPGADNFAYVRISNLSTAAPANACDATLYWTPPTSLLLPSDWRLIGNLATPVDVAAGGRVVAGPVVWRPTAAELPYGGHGCFIAQLDHPQDPRPIPAPDTITWDEFLAFIGNSNNVAWRNFNVIPALPTAAIVPDPAAAWQGAGFDMRGIPERPGTFDFVIRPLGLPADTQVFWRMPVPISRQIRTHPGMSGFRSAETPAGVVVELPADQAVWLPGIELERDARISMSFGVLPPGGRLAETAGLEIRQYYRRVEVGRITWEFAPAG